MCDCSRSSSHSSLARNACNVRGFIPAAKAIGSTLFRGNTPSCPRTYVANFPRGSDRPKQSRNSSRYPAPQTTNPVHPTIWGDFEMPDGIGIYGGMAPMRPIPGLPEAPGREPRPEADTPGAQRRPGDSWAGCFPAEPAAASPGGSLAADRRISRQVWDIGVMPQKSTRLWVIPPNSRMNPIFCVCSPRAVSAMVFAFAPRPSPQWERGDKLCNDLRGNRSNVTQTIGISLCR